MYLKRIIKNLINEIPYVKELHEVNHKQKVNAFYPPGHYYSPIISVEDIEQRQEAIWEKETIDGIDGIELNTENQKLLVKSFAQYYRDIPFPEHKTENIRYYFENDFYLYTDAIFLYSVMRHFKPKQIIEVGSGFSSAVMLDTNEFFFDNKIQLTFIEPYTERLSSLLKNSDKKSTTIIESFVQSIPLNVFEKLDAGDILFIDSTHVIKTGSDVHYLIFEVLPKLKKGVLIHIHDIFYPFEYPKEWVLTGRNWNEGYFFRSFLMYNNKFEIKLFSHYLHIHHKEVYKDMPLCFKNFGGNLWIEKK
jgi:hypothetical protein